MRRAYYKNKVSGFLMDSSDVIMGKLAQINEFDLDLNQRDAWQKEIDLLKEALQKPEFVSGTILLEYTIPRLCGRIDAVLLLNGVVFVIEFKVGEKTYPKEAIKQVLEYCLDLKYFHQASENLELVPMLVCTKAETPADLDYSAYFETIYKPICCASGSKLQEALCHFSSLKKRNEINAEEWRQSAYSPTPTIIEAARALYANHSVTDISRTSDDSRATNLTHTTEALNTIIDNTIAQKEKAICFLTGVPGAGDELNLLEIITPSYLCFGQSEAKLNLEKCECECKWCISDQQKQTAKIKLQKTREGKYMIYDGKDNAIGTLILQADDAEKSSYTAVLTGIFKTADFALECRIRI